MLKQHRSNIIYKSSSCMSAGIKVFAPASVGNVGVGFDCLGFALDAPGDEIVARLVDRPGVRINAIYGAQGKLPLEVERNTAGLAALRTYEHIGRLDQGIEMDIHKKMPFGSGLGSSAASAVAGAMAVNELMRRPLEKRALLPFAMAGEELASGSYHADNVAPSLIGGAVLVRDNATLDVHRLPLVRGLRAVVIYPQVEIMTKDARGILSDTIPLKKHVEQSSNLGGLIVGMFRGDMELIGRSLRDVIIEPQRAQLIPLFDTVKAAALEEGALGCSISGSGPSIFALCANTLIAENVGIAMERIYKDAKIRTKLYHSAINQEGAVRY